MPIRSIFILVCLLLLVSVSSCRKEGDPYIRPDRDHSAAVDNSRAERYFADVLKQSDIAFKDGADGINCIQLVTIDMEAMPHTMLVDFGPTDCIGPNGVARRGQLLVTFTGAYTEAGTVITIIPQDFFVNGNAIQGVKTVTNAGLDNDARTHFNVVVNGTVTAADGSWTSSHAYQRTRTWIHGEGTPALLDDVYLITGGGSGIDRNGSPFTVEITSPLRVEVGCPWIVSGVQKITPSGLTPRIVDHGNGNCDQQMSITVGQYTFNIGG